ncbi:PREDICTED: nodulation-signaling pathway 1 protein [Ipomoea nil]|uniref:nodulation-signaling pathway 1 protein n=1 Tax=Ipomoea nil TaxID=35883 RepID=UPI00090119DC|nr:PREDICTED: nodulation-signaling pathway 1 protein [Ipomoea nil]
MTIDEPAEPSPFPDQILEWFGGSNFSYDSSFLDCPYDSNDHFFGDSDSWWDQGQSLEILHKSDDNNNNGGVSTSLNSFSSVVTTAAAEVPVVLDHPAAQPPVDRKRKARDDGEAEVEVEQAAAPGRKGGGNRKGTNKAGGNGNSNNGGNKDGRWAEQLLNPCAAAITAGNMNRVQHLLYVLSELASLTGDANHRLAAHGLQALTHHLGSGSSFAGVTTFASTTTKFFRESLMIFNDINPWFRIPNSFANSSILEALAEEQQDRPRCLHILDIGVSHGIQWPTLLEELTHRPGGPPPLVRLTVITPTVDNHLSNTTPFLIPPSGYDFSPNLLGFAKAININLQINILDNLPLQNLGAHVHTIKSSQDEILIVCAQFRLHNLNHHAPDERTELLKALRSLGPKRVVLSENNAECSCSNCGDFAAGFSRKVEYLWRFLESTSMAFKGRWNEERRMMEGEAAKALINTGEMNERKEKWCERMRGVGFAREEFGEDAIDGARMLLRKYDNNWEMKVEEKDGCVDLWWKGQPLSFTSLWKMDPNHAFQ